MILVAAAVVLELLDKIHQYTLVLVYQMVVTEKLIQSPMVLLQCITLVVVEADLVATFLLVVEKADKVVEVMLVLQQVKQVKQIKVEVVAEVEVMYVVLMLLVVRE